MKKDTKRKIFLKSTKIAIDAFAKFSILRLKDLKLSGSIYTMIKIFSTVTLILILAGIALSQTKSADVISKQLKTLKADKIYSLTYDKPSNNSKIYGFSENFGEAKSNNLTFLRFGLAFFFSGNALSAKADSFNLTFQADGKKPVFAASHALKFTIDGETLDLGDARYVNKDMEYLNFKLTREQLSKIAMGKNISAKIGAIEAKFKPAHIKMFSDLLALSDPATN